MAAHAAIDESQALGGSGAAPASSGRAWLPHYVFTVTGPPTADSGRIVKVEATAPPSSRTVTGFLRLLNEGLVAADVCHNGGRDWTGDDPQQVRSMASNASGQARPRSRCFRAPVGSTRRRTPALGLMIVISVGGP